MLYKFHSPIKLKNLYNNSIIRCKQIVFVYIWEENFNHLKEENKIMWEKKSYLIDYFVKKKKYNNFCKK